MIHFRCILRFLWTNSFAQKLGRVNFLKQIQVWQIIQWFPVHRENIVPLNLCPVEEITNELFQDISNLWRSTFFSWHPSGWKKQDQFWKVFLRKRRFDWCSVRGKQTLWYFFLSKHRCAWFHLRKKNNLLSDCIFYLTLGLLIFYLLNLYYFHTFSSFLLQPAPFPCALIEEDIVRTLRLTMQWNNTKRRTTCSENKITAVSPFSALVCSFTCSGTKMYLIFMKIFSDIFNLLL